MRTRHFLPHDAKSISNRRVTLPQKPKILKSVSPLKTFISPKNVTIKFWDGSKPKGTIYIGCRYCLTIRTFPVPGAQASGERSIGTRRQHKYVIPIFRTSPQVRHHAEPTERQAFICVVPQRRHRPDGTAQMGMCRNSVDLTSCPASLFPYVMVLSPRASCQDKNFRKNHSIKWN